MGTYTARWKERKSFLLSSMIIGAVLAIILTVLIGLDLQSDGGFLENAILLLLIALVLFLVFTAVVAVGRLVFGKSTVGGNFATNIVNGLWLTIVNTVTGGWFGLILGLFLFFVFGILFLIVAAWYAIYLPVSSVYLFIMYKKETT